MNAAERTALIQEEIKKAQEVVRKKNVTIGTERLWCKGQWKNFEVYRVPVDALLLNIDNRRFSAERKLMEDKLGHSLDPENNPNDEQSVISILLDTGHHIDGDVVKGKPSKDYIALRKDWQIRGQESPFWIRPDGTVHNGNRRLAVVKRMRVEEGLERTRYVDAIVLDPAEIDEQDLFEMEQREQLTENFKVRYSDINLLMTLRDAAEVQRIDWNDPQDIERVAGELQEFVKGGDKGYAAIQLWAIKYMDDYLKYIGSPGDYPKLIRQIERFRDVGKNMVKMLEEYPDDAVDMLQLQFEAISANITNYDIRVIGKIFSEDRDEYHRLRESIETIVAQTEPNTKLESPDLSTIASDDENEEASGSGPVVSNYPTERVKSAFLDTIDGFKARNLEIASKLNQVASRLRPVKIDQLAEGLEGPEAAAIRNSLEEIVGWVEKAKVLLK
jgi:hypothetical protein